MDRYVLVPDGAGGWELCEDGVAVCAWNAAFPLAVVQRVAALRVAEALGGPVLRWRVEFGPTGGGTRWVPVCRVPQSRH